MKKKHPNIKENNKEQCEMGWNREYGGNLPNKYLHELIAQNFSLANDNGWKIIEI